MLIIAGHSSQKSLENKAKFELKFPSKLDFYRIVVIEMKKILKLIILTLLWFLLVTMVCIAVRGIVYILGLLIGETMAVLLITILLLIFIAIFIYKEFL